jgi:DNA replication protein DnaC
MTDNVKTLRRVLTQEDLVRMRIPRRYWNVQPDLVTDHRKAGTALSPRDVVKLYIEEMSKCRRTGRGLTLYGPNGTGKTSMAVCILKEFRRRHVPGLFVEAALLTSKIVEHEMFDEDQTLFDRMHSVPVLVLDDVGKGILDKTGFGVRTLDALIRHRNGETLITIMTTNMVQSEMKDELMVSTLSSLKEHTALVWVGGTDRREETQSQILAAFEDR